LSRVIAQRKYMIPTEMGNVTVKGQLVNEFDVEDLIKQKAISQALALALVNLGKNIIPGAKLPSYVITSTFVGNTETLKED
jgi:hypothetical protein